MLLNITAYNNPNRSFIIYILLLLYMYKFVQNVKTNTTGDDIQSENL